MLCVHGALTWPTPHGVDDVIMGGGGGASKKGRGIKEGEGHHKGRGYREGEGHQRRGGVSKRGQGTVLREDEEGRRRGRR